MPQLTISEMAQQVGRQVSAIRYYEHIVLFPPAPE
jgi:DNA-binding transcriptional MerR regulator